MIKFTKDSINSFARTGTLQVNFLGRKTFVTEHLLEDMRKDAEEVLDFRLKLTIFLIKKGYSEEAISALFENENSVNIVDRIHINFGLTCAKAVMFLKERAGIRNNNICLISGE